MLVMYHSCFNSEMDTNSIFMSSTVSSVFRHDKYTEVCTQYVSLAVRLLGQE